MKAQIVSFHCVMKNSLGNLISTSFNQDVITKLPESEGQPVNDSLIGLIAALQNVKAGEKKRIFVPAKEAYGLYNPQLLLTVQRSELPPNQLLRIGAEVIHQNRLYRILKVESKRIFIDGNHPLAGQDLHFGVHVVSARDASNEDFETPIMTQDLHFLH